MDKDLLRFRRDALLLGESEAGTPDSADGVVDRCCLHLAVPMPLPVSPMPLNKSQYKYSALSLLEGRC